jgi:hypothetical protein
MEQGDTGLSEASRYYGISTNRKWKSGYFRTRSWTHQPYLPTWCTPSLFQSGYWVFLWHVISRRLYTAEDGIRTQVTPCELCGGKKVAVRLVSLWGLKFSLVSIILPIMLIPSFRLLSFFSKRLNSWYFNKLFPSTALASSSIRVSSFFSILSSWFEDNHTKFLQPLSVLYLISHQFVIDS